MRVCPSCASIYVTEIQFCGLDGATLIEQSQDSLSGKVIGKYRLGELIGSGSTGFVYCVTDVETKREFALKLLYGEHACDRRTAERFRREAEAASRIHHNNIVELYDYSTGGPGPSYMVMELLEGRTLAAAITEDGSFSPERTAQIAYQIAAGLAAAHRLGFVHRDLKPGNIMLLPQGALEIAKILDFGIVHGPDDGNDRLTKAGYVVGTPQYMSPEQVEQKEIGPKADLYALGAIMYEMLSGSPPFTGNMEQILIQKLTRPPSPLDAGAIGELAVQLLALDPADRPPSALHVSAEIHRLDLLTEDGRTVLLTASMSDFSIDANMPTVRHEMRLGASGELTDVAFSFSAAETPMSIDEPPRPSLLSMHTHTADQVTNLSAPTYVGEERDTVDPDDETAQDVPGVLSGLYESDTDRRKEEVRVILGKPVSEQSNIDHIVFESVRSSQIQPVSGALASAQISLPDVPDLANPAATSPGVIIAPKLIDERIPPAGKQTSAALDKSIAALEDLAGIASSSSFSASDALAKTAIEPELASTVRLPPAYREPAEEPASVWLRLTTRHYVIYSVVGAAAFVVSLILALHYLTGSSPTVRLREIDRRATSTATASSPEGHALESSSDPSAIKGESTDEHRATPSRTRMRSKIRRISRRRP
jgi:serine/threonine protein kinase